MQGVLGKGEPCTCRARAAPSPHQTRQTQECDSDPRGEKPWDVGTLWRAEGGLPFPLTRSPTSQRLCCGQMGRAMKKAGGGTAERQQPGSPWNTCPRARLPEVHPLRALEPRAAAKARTPGSTTTWFPPAATARRSEAAGARCLFTYLFRARNL